MTENLGTSRTFADRPRLGTEVAGVLREDILTGKYPVGSRLQVADLAVRMGVSTMPVREALVSLQGEGLVEMLPRRGFRVASISPSDIEDTFWMHAVIAGELARRAAEKITDEDIVRLWSLQAEIEKVAGRHEGLSGDQITQFEGLNHEFHATINRVSKSPRLVWFLRATSRYAPVAFFSYPGWVEATADEHPELIRALEEREGERARIITFQHFTHGGKLAAELRRKIVADAEKD